MFNPKIGEMIHFDEHIFQMGCFNHQLDTHVLPILPVSSEPLVFSWCSCFNPKGSYSRSWDRWRRRICSSNVSLGQTLVAHRVLHWTNHEPYAPCMGIFTYLWLKLMVNVGIHILVPLSIWVSQISKSHFWISTYDILWMALDLLVGLFSAWRKRNNIA